MGDYMIFDVLWQFILNGIHLILHVGTNGEFPKPLPEKQELELIEKWQNNKDIDAKNKLIEHNLRLVAHVVKKYNVHPNEQDDLISIGTIGLIKAVNSYHAGKSTRLSTFAAKCIENATLSQMSFWLRKELPIGELPSRRQKICI